MKNYDEFYPTPKSLLEEITKDVNFNKINYILEPSAGKGDMVEFVKEKASYVTIQGERYKSDREIDVDCIEKEEELRMVLEGKGYRVIHDDFLTFNSQKKYDLIIMNPPFSDGASHLLKALEIQKDGGYILCILNAETLRNAYSKERQMLLQKLNSYNADIQFMTNTFTSDAERRTQVEIAVVKCSIPEKKQDSRIIEDLRKSFTNQNRVQQDMTDLAVNDYIEAIIQRFDIESKACMDLIDEYNAMCPYILEDIQENNYTEPVLSLKSGKHDPDKNLVLKKIRSKYWKALFTDPRFVGGMTSNQRREYINSVQELSDYDFSYYNIKTIQVKMARSMVKGIEECILSMFDELSHEYSWLPETGRNIHYYSGWSSNKAHLINKKVVLPMNGIFSAIWKRYEYRYTVVEKLRDLEKIFDYLNGTPGAEHYLAQILEKAENEQQTKKISCYYFDLNFYKKGTVHITFKDEELLKKFNIFGGQHKAWLPPCYGKKPYQDMTDEEKTVINDFEGEASYHYVYENAKKMVFNTQLLLVTAV